MDEEKGPTSDAKDRHARKKFNEFLKKSESSRMSLETIRLKIKSRKSYLAVSLVSFLMIPRSA
ncbi:TPA: hypothetical protein N0F65_009441 [Lagenidium giganteum]|uniref:Uncharacterized protein n=1 Tax=Lagenidium giganteum TaxID=4803 RepID=A0AAV2ZGA6_9STRA|nr:TPA: hypothetical protein N0F65_009441 [Lagenidium giganteum]